MKEALDIFGLIVTTIAGIIFILRSWQSEGFIARNRKSITVAIILIIGCIFTSSVSISWQMTVKVTILKDRIAEYVKSASFEIRVGSGCRAGA